MQLKTGDIVEGRITSITSFGVFVDIKEGQSGLVHISEISDTYVNDINEFVKVGDTKRMKVLSVGEDGKIALSIKKAAKDTPSAIKERKPRPKKPQEKPDSSYVWEAESSAPASFEEMMSKFKKSSDEKMSDLKRKNPDARRNKRSSGGR